tara:strand:- start:11142 stop:11648 length:507 start_codon:yes stop_codon:yes gene_type:complete
MKKIKIIGKRNIEAIKNVKDKKRGISKDWSGNLLNTFYHQNYINMLYLNESFDGDRILKKELKNKINGYKNQDKKKNILNIDKLISQEELIEKLLISKLKCYYCKCNCLLLYSNVREKKQWTLDRLNNDIGHYNDNVVISCLECNIKKRRMDDNDFKFIKQMKIIKKN